VRNTHDSLHACQYTLHDIVALERQYNDGMQTLCVASMRLRSASCACARLNAIIRSASCACARLNAIIRSAALVHASLHSLEH
jgi:hypothetical protein